MKIKLLIGFFLVAGLTGLYYFQFINVEEKAPVRVEAARKSVITLQDNGVKIVQKKSQE